MDVYLDCLEIELTTTLQSPQTVNTVFIGGGTPTILQPQQLERLLTLVDNWLPIGPGGEFTCEANPLDCVDEKLSLLRSQGVNRLSLGGQSFNDRKLKLLERDHSGAQLRHVTEQASDYFGNLSLDLIFATPGESLKEWQTDLDSALQLPIRHLSTYGLTIERGAKFFGRWKRGELTEVDDDLQLAMYELAIYQLQDLNWQHYEVSNFCLPENRCRHNLSYWNGHSWWAFGAGAASFLPIDQDESGKIDSDQAQLIAHQTGLSRTWKLSTNHRSTTQYVRLIQQGKSPVAERELLDPESWVRQRLVFGLRQLDGVDLNELDRFWERPVRPLFEPYLSNYIEKNWLEFRAGQLRLTHSGLMISDCLWPDLLASDRIEYN